MASEYTPDLIGVRAYLMTDPLLSVALEEMAKQAYQKAQSIAPVGDPKKDKDSGEYHESLYVEKHISQSRMSFRIGSTSKKAWWVEYGTKKMPKFAVLRRALDAVTGASREPSAYASIEQYDAVNATSARKRALNRANRARKASLRNGGK
jgi:hypothetical protein